MVIRLYLRVRFVSLHAYSGRTQVRVRLDGVSDKAVDSLLLRTSPTHVNITKCYFKDIRLSSVSWRAFPSSSTELDASQGGLDVSVLQATSAVHQ